MGQRCWAGKETLCWSLGTFVWLVYVLATVFVLLPVSVHDVVAVLMCVLLHVDLQVLGLRAKRLNALSRSGAAVVMNCLLLVGLWLGDL